MRLGLEERDGGQWDITEDDTRTTLGRAWPLLTGERGEYAVTRAATPLTRSHAGLVRLAWTMQRGTPVDQQGVVARRYLR